MSLPREVDEIYRMPFWPQVFSTENQGFKVLMAGKAPASEADFAAFQRTLKDLPVRSLVRVLEVVQREFQVRVEMGEIQETTPAPWRRDNGNSGDTVPPAGRGRRARPY